MNNKLFPRSHKPQAPFHLLAARGKQAGFGLIELMVAITISLLMMAAVLTLFLDISRGNSEMTKTNVLIENGRFALQVLQDDVAHAGFWGELDNAIVAPTAIPDPCVVSGWNAAYKNNLLGIPVQGYADGSALAACGVTGVLAASEVLVVRHANTCTASSTCADTGPHIQISGCRNIGIEDAYVIDSSNFPLRKKSCSLASPVPAADLAPRRKVISNLYYLAESNGLPTLMQVALVNGAYGNPQPLVEGIESFHVEYGLDNRGKNGLAVSAANPGDGSADQFVTCAPCTVAQLENVVAVKLYVLARNLAATPGYVDGKNYQLGATTIAAANDSFKRHVFSTTVRLVNPSGRREIP